MEFFVSIIIPTYNRSKSVVKSIESVRNQSFQDFELLVCDDASKDDTESVVKKLGYNKLRFLKNGSNGGNAVTRNLGVREARGEVICFLDSDDTFDPEYLRFVFEILSKNPKVMYGWCGARSIRERMIKEELWIPSVQENLYEYFVLHNRTGLGYGMFFRKEVFIQVGLFDERIRTAVDTDFIFRLAQAGITFGVIPHFLVNVNRRKMSGANVSRDILSKFHAYKIISQKHLQLIKQNDQVAKKIYHKLIRLAFESGDSPSAAIYYKVLRERSLFDSKTFFTLYGNSIFGSRFKRIYYTASKIKKVFLLFLYKFTR